MTAHWAIALLQLTAIFLFMLLQVCSLCLIGVCVFQLNLLEGILIPVVIQPWPPI
jgi:hypothetical protein